jgi:iron complex transport system substrate-binding protein
VYISNAIFRLSLVSWLVSVAISGHAAITAIDDRQQEVVLDRPAQRIIAIAPHLAELVHAAGAGDRLVATVRGADYPSAVLAIPIIGDAAGLDFERIRQLEPDLILAWGSGNRAADLERLERDGIVLYVVEARLLDDISRHLREIGKLAGTTDAAERAATDFDERLRWLRSKFASNDVVDVFVEIWHRPIFTVGDKHLLTDVLRTCGGRNVLGDYPLLTGPIPPENILSARADVILSLAGMKAVANVERWQKLLPVTEHTRVTVITLSPDLLTRATPRMLDGAELLCVRVQHLRGHRPGISVRPGRFLGHNAPAGVQHRVGWSAAG